MHTESLGCLLNSVFCILILSLLHPVKHLKVYLSCNTMHCEEAGIFPLECLIDLILS